jgi:hypothetical protein
VVVHDLHRLRVTILPDEADAVSIVDPNTVLPAPVASERFQPVPRKRREVPEVLNDRIT